MGRPRETARSPGGLPYRTQFSGTGQPPDNYWYRCRSRRWFRVSTRDDIAPMLSGVFVLTTYEVLKRACGLTFERRTVDRKFPGEVREKPKLATDAKSREKIRTGERAIYLWRDARSRHHALSLRIPPFPMRCLLSWHRSAIPARIVKSSKDIPNPPPGCRQKPLGACSGLCRRNENGLRPFRARV